MRTWAGRECHHRRHRQTLDHAGSYHFSSLIFAQHATQKPSAVVPRIGSMAQAKVCKHTYEVLSLRHQERMLQPQGGCGKVLSVKTVLEKNQIMRRGSLTKSIDAPCSLMGEWGRPLGGCRWHLGLLSLSKTGDDTPPVS